MSRGRRPTGPDYVWKLTGSAQACQRLEVILQTLGGAQSVAGACSVLGIAPTRFHQLRQEALQAAVQSLEPGLAGRPASRTPVDPRIDQLRAEVRDLQLQLQAAEVRAELAAVLPRLAGPPPAPTSGEEDEGKKTSRRRTKRPHRRRRRQP
jgi:hypothetical protein